MEQNRIKEMRKAQKMTQVELAQKLGTTQGTIQKLEAGQSPPDTKWMRNIAEALGIEPYELLPLDMQPKEITPEEKEILRVIRKNAPSQGADNSHIPAQATDKKDINQPPQPPHKSNER